jgi:hypothetical protein
MSDVFTATAIFEIASAVVTGVATDLALTPAGAPDRIEIVNGAVAWDECACGDLLLSVPRVYSSKDFPQPNSDSRTRCVDVLIVAEMTLDIVRCVPTPDDNGSPPTAADIIVAAATAFTDLSVVRDSVKCILDDLFNTGQIQDYLVGMSTPLGPSGGCGGSELDFFVSWLGCGC